ncbi:MAG TPA: VWA domain-containing protein [Thermoanaerobaculia bacterium]
MSPFLHGQSRGKVDWIFLVDTSASMRGVGGTQNIFPDVQESLKTFVREASEGDSVSVLTFDRDVRSQRRRDLRSEADRDALYSTIENLEATGDRTHLGLAIAEGLERAASVRAPNRSRAVVLFTDGKEDVRGIRNPVSIPSTVRLAGDSHVFFVSMGEHEPQLDQFPNATVLKAPTPEAIRGVADQIRERLKPPPAPKPAVITIAPQTLDLGQLELGSTVERELTITSDKPAKVAIRIEAPVGVTAAPIGDVATPATIKLRLMVADDAAPGEKQIAIQAGNANAAAKLQVLEASLAARLAKWLIALALLIAAAIAFLRFRKAQNRLEGELEIVQPHVAPDAAFVGLPRLKTDAVALSAIVPADVLAGSDARLFVRRSRGEKKVVIAAQDGPMRVNDVETPVSELYDADLIQIGDAKLRFNRAGYVRASSTGEEL